MAQRTAAQYDDDLLFARQGNVDDDFPTDEIDLQHYLRILRKYKWPIVLFTALVTALASYFAFTATPIYRSTSTLLIESQRAAVVSVEELVGLDNENQDYYQTQYELLKSRGLAVRVINALNLWSHPQFSPGAALAATNVQRQRNIQTGDNAAPEGGVAGALHAIKTALGLEQGATAAQPVAAPGSEADVQVSTTAGNNAVATVTVDATQSEFEAGSVTDALLATVDIDPASLNADQKVVVDRFMSQLTIAPVRNTKLVKISFESPDPELATRIANTVGEEYINAYLDARMELTTKASTWLNARLEFLKERLDQSEQRLLAYKQENGLVDVGGSVGRLNEQELLLATTELAQARSELANASSLFREVNNLRGQPDLLESVPAIQADALVQRTKIEQGQVQRQLDELLNRYGDRHPRVVDARSQLASLQSTLNGHINRVIGSIEQDYQLLQQRVGSIEAKLASGKQEIQSLGTKTFELQTLEREVQTNRNIYDTFFNRMTEAKSADGLEAANARISDFAVAPISPVKPKKELIIALAALASLVLSMLMAFLYEQMDDTIKSTNDVEHKLGLKLLGILPLIKSGLLNRRRELPLSPVDIPDKKGTFVEAVNTTRTALALESRADEPRQVIVVTSSIPGEGKSTSAINLAYSFAQLDRVLLIDCDMRRPTVAKACDLDRNTPGLSSLIAKTASARECIKRGMLGGKIDVLPSGPIPDQPLELLSSKRFENLLNQLREHYDRIIIDCAPTQAVSDALVLSRMADAVVYVIKSHDTSIELVKRGIQRLRQVGANVVGALITQVDIDKIVSYGGDYYYQGYYDYYGYNDKATRGDKPRTSSKLRLTPEELARIRADDSQFDLGLEHVNGSAGVNGSHAGGMARRSAARGASLDVDEFDQTTQVDVSERYGVGDAPGRSAQRSRSNFSDDLDII